MLLQVRTGYENLNYGMPGEIMIGQVRLG